MISINQFVGTEDQISAYLEVKNVNDLLTFSHDGM